MATPDPGPRSCRKSFPRVPLAPSERVGVFGDRGGNRMLIEARRVLPCHFSDDRCGKTIDLLVDLLLGVWPRGVAVRVVGLEQDVVRADPLMLNERRLILHRTEPEVAFEDLCGRQGFPELPPCPVHLVVAQHVVESVEQARDPSDAALRKT